MKPFHLITSDKSAGAVRVDRFPEAPHAVATINIHSANFVGKVVVEATIKLDPQDADWFVLHTETFEPITMGQDARRNRITNKEGRFISMRATATKADGFPHGIIDRVTIL
jgi:hypothetical protein